MKNFAVALFCLVAAGCGYGPAHHDAFYAQRNHYQHLIDDIEGRYNLKTRDADKGQVPGLKDTIHQLQKDNEVLKARLEMMREHSGTARN